MKLESKIHKHQNLFGRHLVIFLFLFPCILLLSCQQGEVVNQLQKEPYFDLKGLINQQIAILDSLNPPVEIKAKIKDAEETITTQKDSSTWRASLKLLRDADINQPVLQGSYIVKDSFDSQQGLQLKLYEAKENADTSIPYLKVYYQDSIANIKRIETVFQEINVLYSTQRIMSATFDHFEGKPRIMRFETQGKQKMLFKDSIFYGMQAKIEYSS